MPRHLTLDDLTFESSELLEKTVRADEAGADQILNPMQSKEFDDMMMVFETHSMIVERKYICRSDMERMKDLTGTYPSLGRLIKKYPINSFTEEPSRINYDVSTESFARTAYEAVIKALKDILEFICNSFKKLWKFLSANSQRTAAVDDLEEKLLEVQRYIINCDRALAGSAAAEEFSKVRKGAFENQYHNVSKRWTGFKELVLSDPVKTEELLETISGVLKVKVPPFVEQVEEFLLELTKAETEADVKTAVLKMELLDMTSSGLIKLAASEGYRPHLIKINPNMTKFHSVGAYVYGVFRSWENNHIAMDRQLFDDTLVTLKITKWAEKINETIKWAEQRTDRVTAKLAEFNEKSLKPGLEDTYINELVPFFKALTSTIQGFSVLAQCLGMLVTNRDNVTIAICEAARNSAKVMDAWIVEHKDELSVAARALIKIRRDALNAAFTK